MKFPLKKTKCHHLAPAAMDDVNIAPVWAIPGQMLLEFSAIPNAMFESICYYTLL
jgi:hypothetical protein